MDVDAKYLHALALENEIGIGPTKPSVRLHEIANRITVRGALVSKLKEELQAVKDDHQRVCNSLGAAESRHAKLADLIDRQAERIAELEQELARVAARAEKVEAERDKLVEHWPDGENGCTEIELIDGCVWQAASPLRNGRASVEDFDTRAAAVRFAAGLDEIESPKGGDS